MGRSRGGLTTKIHAIVDADGLPVQLVLTRGEVHDNRLCSALLKELGPRTMLLADRGYDADQGARQRARRVGQYPAKTKSQRTNLLQSISVSRT